MIDVYALDSFDRSMSYWLKFICAISLIYFTEATTYGMFLSIEFLLHFLNKRRNSNYEKKKRFVHTARYSYRDWYHRKPT